MPGGDRAADDRGHDIGRDRLEHAVGMLVQPGVGEDRGVVDPAVQRREHCGGLRRGLGDGGVARIALDVAAFEVEHDHRPAIVAQHAGNRRADPARPTGDDHRALQRH
jgi:hypothetical protein